MSCRAVCLASSVSEECWGTAVKQWISFLNLNWVVVFSFCYVWSFRCLCILNFIFQWSEITWILWSWFSFLSILDATSAGLAADPGPTHLLDKFIASADTFQDNQHVDPNRRAAMFATSLAMLWMLVWRRWCLAGRVILTLIPGEQRNT